MATQRVWTRMATQGVAYESTGYRLLSDDGGWVVQRWAGEAEGWVCIDLVEGLAEAKQAAAQDAKERRSGLPGFSVKQTGGAA